MWKSATVIRLLLPKANSKIIVPSKRYFLSDSFRLEKVWNDRFNSPILKKINVDDMFYELDNQFNRFAYASALDIDLFVNAVNEEVHFDEIEEIVHKLRLSPEAVNIFPSTQHALIRLYMKFDKTSEILRILDDRLNYGIFPDVYCRLMMMDTFIKQGNFRDAAKVSVLSMLQEDVSNPLIKYMSLYACHKYIENPVPWKEEEISEENKDDDDDEVIKVRVRFIRNPYFDDHFDLVDPQHLIGKTFYMISSESSDSVGNTYRLLGLILNDKLADGVNFVKLLSSNNDSQVLVKEGLDMAFKILEEKLKTESKDEKYHSIAQELIESLKTIFSESQLVAEINLMSLVEEKLKELVKEREPEVIRTQMMLYQEWEDNRVAKLEEQIARINKEKDIAEIAYQKQQLEEKEEELFFFENEDKLDLIIEEKERKKVEELERAKKRIEDNMDFKPAVKIERKIKQNKKEIPPLESFFDENIPMKNIKTDL